MNQLSLEDCEKQCKKDAEEQIDIWQKTNLSVLDNLLTFNNELSNAIGKFFLVLKIFLGFHQSKISPFRITDVEMK